ncbi:hypothetical protein B0H14DRAFT_2601364 [Mycena olivaceomarginata]|nr:hypothetical protein B0H14DRAFT_2601364 [Mycena olivaceomarginata]
MLVVLGSSPESFYVDCGRRHAVENMSASFTNSALNISTLWIRHLFPLAYNTSSLTIHFNANLEKRCEPGTFLHQWYGKWRMQQLPDFDKNITGMLFGQGNVSIYLLKTGFIADLNGDAEIEQVCIKMDGWCNERGSISSSNSSARATAQFVRNGTFPRTSTRSSRSCPALRPAQPDEMLDEKWAQVASQRIVCQVSCFFLQLDCSGQVAAHEQVIANANRAVANVYDGVYVECIGYLRAPIYGHVGIPATAVYSIHPPFTNIRPCDQSPPIPQMNFVELPELDDDSRGSVECFH